MHSSGVLQLSSFSSGCFTAGLYVKAKISPSPAGDRALCSQSVPQEAWVRHRKHPQALLGVVQRGFPPFIGNHSPFSPATKTQSWPDKIFGYCCKCSCFFQWGDVATLEKSQSCKGVMFLYWYHQQRRHRFFFSKTDLFHLSLLAQGRCVTIHLKL